MSTRSGKRYLAPSAHPLPMDCKRPARSQSMNPLSLSSAVALPHQLPTVDLLLPFLPPPATFHSLPAAVVVHSLLSFLSFCDLMDVRAVSRSFRAGAESLAIARADGHFGPALRALTLSTASSFSLRDVAWLRQRLDWLFTRRYNLGLEAQSRGGDFELWCDFWDAQLLGLDVRDAVELKERWSDWSLHGAWLNPVQPFARVFSRALERVGTQGMEALKQRWRSLALALRGEVARTRGAGEQRRAQLRAALSGVGVELSSLPSSEAEAELWDGGDFSFGWTTWWLGDRWAPCEWRCRSRTPMSPRFVLVHRALAQMGMGKGGCKCATNVVGCCLLVK